MQKRTAFLLLAFAVVALTMGGATPVIGQVSPETCTTDNGRWQVTIDPPESVNCTDVVCVIPGCLAPTPADNKCTRLKGNVTTLVGANTSLVAGVSTSNVTLYNVSGTSAVFPFGDGGGSSLDDFAKHVSNLAVIKFTSNGNTYNFNVTAVGNIAYVRSAWLVKDGNKYGDCENWGLGAPTNPFQPKVTTVTESFKGCTISIPIDPVTGVPGVATVTGPSGCRIEANGAAVNTLELFVNNVSLGLGTFAEGRISTGTNSCTTSLIGGKVYVYGNPCP